MSGDKGLHGEHPLCVHCLTVEQASFWNRTSAAVWAVPAGTRHLFQQPWEGQEGLLRSAPGRGMSPPLVGDQLVSATAAGEGTYSRAAVRVHASSMSTPDREEARVLLPLLSSKAARAGADVRVVPLVQVQDVGLGGPSGQTGNAGAAASSR